MYKNYSILPSTTISVDLQLSKAFGILPEFILPTNRQELQQKIEQIFIKNIQKEKLLVTFCVRTSFLLTLQACNFERGSEIILSCINIPNMIQIIRHCGYIPIPLAVQPDTLAIELDDVKKVVTSKTKAILLSYYFGARYDPSEIFQYCQSKGIITIEDEAESFDDVNRNGNVNSDVTMFSFGTIKPNTSLGGSLAVIRNQKLYHKMQQILESYPVKPNSFYMKKMSKFPIMKIVTQSQFINYYGCQFFKSINYDYRESIVKLVRGFNTFGTDFLSTFQYQVPIPCIALIYQNLVSFDYQQYHDRQKKLFKAQERLLKAGIMVPGYLQKNRTFWLFPILCKKRLVTDQKLNELGVAGYSGSTQLKFAEAPVGYKYHNPVQTKEFFDSILFIPININTDEELIEEIVSRVINVCQELGDNQQIKIRPRL